MNIEAGQQISIWSVRIALAFWFLFGLVSLQSVRRAQITLDSGSGLLLKRRRWTWFLATLFLLIHVVLAFAYFHDWSHRLAMEHTAAVTAEFTGINWSGGIWFNHLLLLVCMVEAGFWLFLPNAILNRSYYINFMVYGFCAFMILNAGVVFVSGWIRWANLAGFICLGIYAMSVVRIPKDLAGGKP